MGAEIEDPRIPPWVVIFKAMAKEVAKQNAEQKRDYKLGKVWLESFLNRHPNGPSKFGFIQNRPRPLAGSPGPFLGCSYELMKALKELNFLPEYINDMYKRGFTLGMSNREKVMS